jgi:formylglycine-generating enzyme required for sulfatase activity
LALRRKTKGKRDKVMKKIIMSIFFMFLMTLTNACTGIPTQATNEAGDTLVVGGVTFVKIPAGAFEMGGDSSQASANEQPVHQVTLNSFWMASTEITFAQWQVFLDNTGYPAGRSQAEGDAYPVVGITWEDAQAYCEWFSENYGVVMRLPTEAEWEYAARGGLEGKEFPNGDTISPEEANYASDGALPVAQYSPNGYGLYDVAGNVGEWVADWYDKDYYQVSPSNNPQGPATKEGELQRRADRGGGWCFGIQMVRVSTRHAGPGSWDEGGTADCLGFRPVLQR